MVAIVYLMPLRNAILEAAIKELQENSEAGFRVTRVADEAGCVVSVLYHHFNNREGLIDAALVEIMRKEGGEVSERFEPIIASASSINDVVTAFKDYAQALHGPSRADNRNVRLQVLAAQQSRPLVQSAWRSLSAQTQQTNEGMIESLKANGLLDNSLDTATVALFMRMLDFGRILDESMEAPFVDLEAWIDFIGILAERLLRSR